MVISTCNDKTNRQLPFELRDYYVASVMLNLGNARASILLAIPCQMCIHDL